MILESARTVGKLKVVKAMGCETSDWCRHLIGAGLIARTGMVDESGKESKEWDGDEDGDGEETETEARPNIL